MPDPRARSTPSLRLARHWHRYRARRQVSDATVANQDCAESASPIALSEPMRRPAEFSGLRPDTVQATTSRRGNPPSRNSQYRRRRPRRVMPHRAAKPPEAHPRPGEPAAGRGQIGPESRVILEYQTTTSLLLPAGSSPRAHTSDIGGAADNGRPARRASIMQGLAASSALGDMLTSLTVRSRQNRGQLLLAAASDRVYDDP